MCVIHVDATQKLFPPYTGRQRKKSRKLLAPSVITTVFATSGRSSLMPRLWPIPRGALRTTEVIRLKYDISAALEMLHRSHIVHADVHADNLMLRAEPPCFVLIDYSGCTGDSVYPLHLGYGAFGYGGATHRPPTLESSPAPVRTAHGDYFRLARTILKQLYIGPEPSKRRHSDKDSSLPSHLDKELRIWLERDQWPRPPSPTSPFPPGSWKDSAVSPSIILHASLWRANGEVKQDTATFTSPDSKFGNSNGALVPEGVANDGLQGTGSWENSAISARFFLKCQLRTCGRFARTIYQEIFPWQAYSNQDGYLVPANPPPPPPAPATPAESLTTGQYGDGGLAHLTMQSATAVPTAVTADGLQGIWGAGQAASVSDLPEAGGFHDVLKAVIGDACLHVIADEFSPGQSPRCILTKVTPGVHGSRNSLRQALKHGCCSAFICSRVTLKSLLPVPASGVRHGDVGRGDKVVTVVAHVLFTLQLVAVFFLKEVYGAIRGRDIPAHAGLLLHVILQEFPQGLAEDHILDVGNPGENVL